MGGDAGTVELAVASVKPGETIVGPNARPLLVLAVVDLSDEPGSEVRALLEVEELPRPGR